VRRIRHQAGDTIVEVLLAVVVVGIGIGLGYGVATRSLKLNRQSQERVEALKKVESQIERLKKLAATDNGSSVSGIFRSTPYCIADIAATPAGTNNIISLSSAPPNDLSADPLGSAYNSSCIQGLYHMSITPVTLPDPSIKQFRVTARWFGIGASQKEETTIMYRIYPAVGP